MPAGGGNRPISGGAVLTPTSICIPGNTGDGIIMALKVGAALWHMTGAPSHQGFKPLDYQATFQIHYRDKGFIHVNKQGKRFCNELGREFHDSWRDFSDVDPEINSG